MRSSTQTLSAVLLLASATAFAAKPSGDPGDPTLSSYATPVRGDVIEWRAPSRSFERAIMFPEGSSQLSKRVKGALGSLAKEIGPKAQVTVIGRDDQSLNEGLPQARVNAIVDGLVAAGLPKENIVTQLAPESAESAGKDGARFVASHVRWTVPGEPLTVAPKGLATQLQPSAVDERVVQRMVAKGAIDQSQADTLRRQGAQSIQVAGVPLKSSFDIFTSDKDLATTLSRWGEVSGYRVVWESSVPAPVTGDLTLSARSFLDALAQVIGGLQSAGYPIKAQHMANNEIRITSTDSK